MLVQPDFIQENVVGLS